MLLITLGPSDVVGELSVIDGGVRSASVVALKPTTGIVIGRKPLIALMQRRPELLDVLLRSMGALVRRLTERATDLVFLDPAARVAKLLLRVAEERGGEQRQMGSRRSWPHPDGAGADGRRIPACGKSCPADAGGSRFD